MDSSDSEVSKENGGSSKDIIQTVNTSKPIDDYELLQESMSAEVTHRDLPDDQGLSIDTPHDEKALSTSLVDPTGEKELPKIQILQNKPKRSMSSPVASEDYVCTETDIAIIESVKKIPSSPGKEELVLIDDVPVSRNHMECLFQPQEYLSDEVIDAYITLLKAQEGLKKRQGGTVYLETACLTAVMKWDGEKKESIVDHYPKRGTSQRPGLVQRVLTYLDHDMVFLPVNVTHTHWYLAVINADKREVQRVGLRKQIDFVLEETGLKEHKWPDVEVDIWPVEEIFRGKLLQKDGFSCGLFLITFMEYWTGNDLSDEFNQDDMKEFRLKLAAILLSSELNKRKGDPYIESDENIGCPSDCVIIDNPNMADQASTKKRKHSEGAKCLVVQKGTSQHIQAQNKSSQVNADQDPDEFWAFEVMKDVPMNKEEMTELLCDYVMAIQNEVTLKKPWVKGFHPSMITLSVQDLQELLMSNLDISENCFNLGVRFQAAREYNIMKKYNNITKHHMDLRFCKMCALTQMPEFRKKYTKTELAAAIGVCGDMEYNLAQCRYFLLPWLHIRKYMLYVFDQREKILIMIDPRPVEEWCKDTPALMYARFTLGFSYNYTAAVNIHIPGWTEDVFKWKFKREENIAEDIDGHLSGYLILQYMSAWNRRLSTPICTDGIEMRRNLFVDLLAHERNGYRRYLPADIKHYLSRITEKPIK